MKTVDEIKEMIRQYGLAEYAQSRGAQTMRNDIYTAIEALAQQGQGEAVAWLHTPKRGSAQAFTTEPPPGLKKMCQPLYTAPKPQQPPTDEQERAEFEAWFAKDGDYEPSNLDRSGAHTGLYMNSDTQQQWEAWQARAAHNIKKGGA